jgi:hypothetical protein
MLQRTLPYVFAAVAALGTAACGSSPPPVRTP